MRVSRFGKADLLSDHFDSKQSREAVALQLTCHPSPSLTTSAFRSSEVRRLLLDLDPYGGTDPLIMFPHFFKRTAAAIPGVRVTVAESLNSTHSKVIEWCDRCGMKCE